MKHETLQLFSDHLMNTLLLTALKSWSKRGLTALAIPCERYFQEGHELMKILPHKNRLQATKDFRWASQRAFQLGLQTSSGGNITIRLGPRQFLTKPTGIGLHECLDSDLVIVDAKAQPREGDLQPTKDVQVHLAIFEARSDLQAIVHYHAPYATAFAVKGQGLPLPTLHARRILRQIPLIPEYPEGSPQLASAAVKALENREVVGLLLANHGLMAIGHNLRQAQYHAELMEESARIQWLARHIM
jgi:L-ribulose-5-phosphate 4-epimerase